MSLPGSCPTSGLLSPPDLCWYTPCVQFGKPAIRSGGYAGLGIAQQNHEPWPETACVHLQHHQSLMQVGIYSLTLLIAKWSHIKGDRRGVFSPYRCSVELIRIHRTAPPSRTRHRSTFAFCTPSKIPQSSTLPSCVGKNVALRQSRRCRTAGGTHASEFAIARRS
jgi:hypothetical protein